MTKLNAITHLIIDMDGVLYRGDQPAPRLQEFFAFLRRQNIQFILATNNSTRTPEAYTLKLAGMGVTVSPGEVLVSGQATARYLAQEYPRGTRVHVFGMASLRQALIKEGFVLADDNVELVVASMDREVTYEKLKRASLLIQGGARFIATNLDPTNPSEEGFIPGTGTMIAALQTASGVKPVAIGKPEPIMYNLAIEQMGARPETTAAIGDRVDTDLVGGRRAGLTTIAILWGSSSLAEVEEFGPDYTFEHIGNLLAAWEAAVA